MDCEKAFEMMSLYLDGQLNREEQGQLFEHMKNCNYCKQEFEFLKNLVDTMKDEAFLPLPEGYHEDLMAKINKNKVERVDFSGTEKNKKRKWKKYGSIAAAGLLVVLVGAGAGRGLLGSSYGQNDAAGLVEQKSQSYSGTEEMPFAVPEESMNAKYAMDESQETQSNMGAGMVSEADDVVEEMERTANVEERKKIKTAYVTLNVENFEQAVENIRGKVETSGGYVENYNSYVYQQNKDESLKAGNITLRLDKDNYEQMKLYIKSMGEVTYEDENVNDVTSQYIDTQGRLKAKRVEEERLLELLESAENVQDIIAIEERLGNIRSDIESYQSSIDNWDKLVDLSTINVELKEKEPVAIGTLSSNFGTKIKENFIRSVNMLVNGFQNLVLWLVTVSLPLVVIVAAVLIVVGVIIKRRKKPKS